MGTIGSVSGIYWIRNTLTGKFYIGSSKNVSHRLHHHYSSLQRGKHYNAHLQRSWNRDGEQAFKMELVEAVPLESLIQIEQWYLDNTRCLDRKYGFNLSPTAYFTVLSEETKRKIGDAQKGRKCPKSAETRMKISKSLMGKIGPNRGKIWSDETKAKTRETQKARHAETDSPYKTPEYRKQISENMKRIWSERKGGVLFQPSAA